MGWRGTVLGYQHFGVVKPSFARELAVGGVELFVCNSNIVTFEAAAHVFLQIIKSGVSAHCRRT